MLKIDLHTHTISSGDAMNTVYEMIQAASQMGLEMIALTDHGPKTPYGPSINYFITSLRLPRHLFGIDFMLGCESNIIDKKGGLDIPDRVAGRQDIVLAGLHRDVGWTPSSSEEGLEGVLGAIKNPYVSVISHPHEARWRLDMERLVKEAYERQVLLEVNLTHLSFLADQSVEVMQAQRMIELVKDYKWKLVVSSDAHVATQMGDDSVLDRTNLRRFLTEDIILNSSLVGVKKFFDERRRKTLT
ncbi:MAG: putative hydrolase [Thermoproteota archaeon]|nr:putative hydrolase [Thermoproteota archaeon]